MIQKFHTNGNKQKSKRARLDTQTDKKATSIQKKKQRSHKRKATFIESKQNINNRFLFEQNICSDKFFFI